MNGPWVSCLDVGQAKFWDFCVQGWKDKKVDPDSVWYDVKLMAQDYVDNLHREGENREGM